MTEPVGRAVRTGRQSLIAIVLIGWLIVSIVVPAAHPALAGQRAQPPTCIYTVRSGDTLSEIASRFETTVAQLAQANGIRDLNLIYAGQRLVIPGCDGLDVGAERVRFPAFLRQSTDDLRPIPTPEALSVERERAVRKAAARVVVSGQGMSFQGTGSVIGSTGDTLLTAYHVVARPMTREPRGDAIRLDLPDQPAVRLVDAVPDLDLALLRLESSDAVGLDPVPVGDSDDLDVGDTVYVVGFPSELEGEVSAEGGVIIDILRLGHERRFLVTDAYAGHGSSGGLAVNTDGELIGIVSALFTRSRILDVLGYPELDRATVLIPINQAQGLLGQ
jgi:S1-C subfamily serine protease